MGISIDELPLIGALPPRERREVARWLRQPLPRGAHLSPTELEAHLRGTAWWPEVSIANLRAAGWLDEEDGRLNADTYARRIAAGSVDGNRMSEEEALALASTVRQRIAEVGGELGGVRINRALIYGSAVRSIGNLSTDIGDLDLAFEVEVRDPGLQAKLDNEPSASRWRAAMELSGWRDCLMAGDDRITIAGSARTVINLFWDQLHGRQIPADGRLPAVVVMWRHPATPGISSDALSSAEDSDEDLAPLTSSQLKALNILEQGTICAQPRAFKTYLAFNRRPS